MNFLKFCEDCTDVASTAYGLFWLSILAPVLILLALSLFPLWIIIGAISKKKKNS